MSLQDFEVVAVESALAGGVALFQRLGDFVANRAVGRSVSILPEQAILLAGRTENLLRVLELARCEFLVRRENVLLLGNSGTGKTHLALALGLSACQHGHRVRFTTAAAMVHELLEARDEERLLRYQKQMASYELLIVDELGFVPLSKSGAELLFEVFSQRYERGSTLVTSNLPFQEWTEVLGSEPLTGGLLDRLTHHVHILEMNGESYRLKQSKRKRGSPPNS